MSKKKKTDANTPEVVEEMNQKPLEEIPVPEEAEEAINNYVEYAYSDDLMKAGAAIAAKTCVLEIHFGRVGFTKRIKSDVFMDLVAKKSVQIASESLKISQDIINRKEIADLDNHQKRFKKWLKGLALPGGMLTLGGGQYLVPLSRLEEIYDEINGFIVQRNVYLDAFEKKYPELIEKAKESRGQFFNEADYPAFDSIRKRYTLDYRFISNKVPEEFERVSAEIQHELIQKYAADCASAAYEARMALRVSLKELTDEMLEMLSPGDNGEPKKFNSSRVQKFIEFVNNFGKLDMTNDQVMKDLVDTCKTILSGSGDVVENLKASSDFKQQFKDTFKVVADEISKIVEDEEHRAFDFSDED